MRSEQKTLIILFALVVAMILGCTALGIANAHDAHRHRAPDMSRCELTTEDGGKVAYYTCPYSMGV